MYDNIKMNSEVDVGADGMSHVCLKVLQMECYIHFSIGLNPQVQTYLEEHLLKSLAPRSQLLNRPAIRKGSTMRRRMSVKGAIKKTRSIAVEREYHIHSDVVWKLSSWGNNSIVCPDVINNQFILMEVQNIY